MAVYSTRVTAFFNSSSKTLREHEASGPSSAAKQRVRILYKRPHRRYELGRMAGSVEDALRSIIDNCFRFYEQPTRVLFLTVAHLSARYYRM